MQHTKSILTEYVSLVILIKFQGLRKALIIDLKKAYTFIWNCILKLI